MDKRAVLDRLTRDEDERITLGRVWDLAEKCESRDIPGHTGFLTPQEQLLCQNLLQTLGLEERAVFWGGYDGAQRCQLHLLPSWAEGPEEDAIAALRVRWYTGEHPTHRDLLGSLMGLGITRQTIGDILVDGSGDAADILTVPTTAEYLLQQWDRAGRTPIRCETVALHDLHLPAQEYKEIRDTVSSLRLDSVVAAAFSMARGKAADLIAAGRVQVNWQDAVKGDRPVAQGDVITARGLGKCILSAVGQPTKKGRLPITVQRYI